MAATDNPYLQLVEGKTTPKAKPTGQRLPQEPDYTWYRKPFQQADDFLSRAGEPYPDPTASGPGWQQILKVLANAGMASAAGLDKMAVDSAGGLTAMGGDALTWLLGDHSRMPSVAASEAPGIPTDPTSPSTAVPTTANSLDEYLKTLGLDKTTTIAGSGGMPAFQGGRTDVARPDYSQMDASLAAARPKPSPRGMTDSQAGWQGVSDASTKIDDLESPASALGKLIAGYNSGETNNRQMQMQRDMLDQQRSDEYNLKLAGIEGQRAADEASARNLQIQQENQMVQARMNYDIQKMQMGQAHVQMLGDGSIAVTQVDPNTGNTTVQRVGQADALRSEMMMAQLKAAYGARGVNAAILQDQQTFGPVLGTVVGGFNQMRQTPGLLESIIPPEANKMIEEEVQRYAQQMQTTAGLGSKEINEAMNNKRRELQFQIILSNPQARQSFMGWITPQQGAALPPVH